MKKNLIFIAEKLGLLACVIFMMTSFGRLLHTELDAKWTNAFMHYFFVWFSFGCLLVLLFVAFYLAHEIAVRDYKINKPSKF
jgi:cytochrome oxidase assembly protein ShyY1